ncbi:hypothetical protein F4777DRAFT_412232 [Nemania sp. FL0916]|nr:hypothetical protein F4777DRAFT_412232 [Nemania sp. FL0916]
MTTNMTASRRPNLAPIWTSNPSLSRLPTAAFRAAQGPLLSPSPLSADSVPSPLRTSSSEGPAPKKHRRTDDSLFRKIEPSSATSPKSRLPIEGQSPLVSRLEEVSLKLANGGEVDLPKSPMAGDRNLGERQTTHDLRSREGYGNVATADAFIIARSIRRPDSPTVGTPRPFWESETPESSSSHRLTLRAIIRPKAPERQAFLIQRNIDIEELWAASASTADKRHGSGSPSRASRKPLPVPAKWSSNSRRPSAGLLSPQAERASSKAMLHSTGYDKLIGDSKTVPIYVSYAASRLPALAVLLTSGHIHGGDIIYLPVPHAESWPQTVRYVYTGEGELTNAMRENIVYLGGKV